jgi:hypothetical protein
LEAAKALLAAAASWWLVGTPLGVGHKHELPAITHPPGVDLSNTRVLLLELTSPGEEVDGRRWQWSWVDLANAVHLAKGLGRER